MKIFFSPSEGKHKPRHQDLAQKLQLESLMGHQIIKESLEAYLELLKKGDDSEICKLFGSKKIDLDTLELCTKILDSECMQALRLYSGVAYDALDFESLDSNSQEFLYQRTYIFSNLFGAVNARNMLPFYKFNQNYKNKKLGISILYARLKEVLDEEFKKEDVLDLRAEVYIKSYESKGRVLRPIFFKNGKKLSHFAKYYRGVMLRSIAEARIDDLDCIEGMVIKDLKPIDKCIKKSKDASEIIELYYEISS